MEQQNCELCLGEGSFQVRNGAEDFDYEFCNCPAGQKLQDEMIEKVETRRYPTCLPADALDWFNKPSPFEV